MHFGLSDIQLSLQDSINRFLDENLSLDHLRKFVDLDDPFDRTFWKELSALGIAGVLIPERYGGVGMSALDATVVSECLGYHVAPAPFLSSAVIGTSAILFCGTEKQKETYLPKIASGDLTIGLGISELCGKRSAAGIASAGQKLSGTALFTMDPSADLFLVADQKARLFLIDRNAEGVTLQKMPQVDRTRHIAALKLSDAFGEMLMGSTAASIQRLIDLGRVIQAADTLGAAQAMLDKAVEYAMQREQFNRVIASFQAVKHMCAEMAAEIEPSRALVWYAGHALDDIAEEAHLTACHAKAHLAEVGTFVAKTATVVHGGMGFTDLLGLHYWFKRIGFNRQYLGSPEFTREEAARTQGLVI